jgi:hypothetical protein
MYNDPEQPEWFNKIMRAQSTHKRASGSDSAPCSAASWKLTWFVTGWLNGHSEEHECLDDALDQLEELSDDPTLQITLTREGQLPPNDRTER